MAWCELEPGTDPRILAIGAAQAEHDLCRQIPGCTYSKEDSLWRVPVSWPAVGALGTIWAHQPITLYPELLAWQSAKLEEIQARVADRYAEDCEDPDLSQRLALIELEHAGPALTAPQRGHVRWLTRWRRCILADARGSGKTPPLIRSLQVLALTGDAFPALVACPDSAPLSWARKLARWAPEIRVVLITGTAGNRRKAIEALAGGEADVGIIAWQNLRQHTRLGMYPGQAYVRCNDHGGVAGKTPASCEVHQKELNAGGFRIRTVIADEAHRMANPAAKQTRAMWWLAHHAENFWAVTGTPVVNDVGDLWSILHAIDPAGWPVRSRYLDLFAVQAFAWQSKGREVLDLRADNAGTFHWLIDPLIRRVPPEVAREGQPLMLAPEFRYPAFTPAQERAYREFRRAGLADLGDGIQVVPENTAVKFTRMWQLSSATIISTDGEDEAGFTRPVIKVTAPSNKADDLVEFLADEEGQWVVASTSPEFIALAAAALDDPKAAVSHTRIVGGMDSAAKDAAAQAFQNGEYRVIFLTPGAGGESIDLDAAEGIVWLDPTPSWVERDQANGRVDRGFARTAPARQVHMITPGGTDPRMYRLGCDKQRAGQSVVQDPVMLRWLMSAGPGETIGEEGEDHDADSHFVVGD